MPKVKTRKSILKRLKVTSTGKLLKRHQLSAGHLRRKKSKGALEKHAKMSEIYSTESKTLKKALGI